MTPDRARLEELVQADLDGELSVAERADLARLLLRDPGARSLHDGYRETDRLLRAIPAAEPPAGLREGILARSGRSAPADRAGRGIRDRSNYRVAAAIAAGLVIVGVGYLLRDGSGAGTDLQGSLGAAGGRASGAAATQDHLSMRAEGVELDATLRRIGPTLRLELEVSSPIPCEIVARVDPSTTTLVGSFGDATPTSTAGQITLDAAAGRRAFVLDFAGSAPIHLELRSGGRLLVDGRLSVGGS